MIAYPIYIMGFMASGKSTFGKKLATLLGVDFIETDRLIEEREKKSIQQIFDEKGELYFRKLEKEILQNMDLSKKTVIALGGGTPCTAKNINWIHSHGSSIYLKLSTDLLIGRLRQNKQKRPLTKSLSDEEIGQLVREKMKERAPYYQSATYSFDIENGTLKEMINLIKNKA